MEESSDPPCVPLNRAGRQTTLPPDAKHSCPARVWGRSLASIMSHIHLDATEAGTMPRFVILMT